MILYLASARNDDGESLDVFISAPNPAAALELFTQFHEERGQSPDGKVTLFPVPAAGFAPAVHDWPHETSIVFNE